METNNWSHAATVFAVSNMEVSLNFYTEILGLELSFQWGDPVTYAVLKRGDVSIHLTLKEDDSIPSPTHNRMYIFVYDIQKAYAEIIQAGGVPLSKPLEQDYKMTDFDIKDPDGHILSFGSGN